MSYTTVLNLWTQPVAVRNDLILRTFWHILVYVIDSP
jgi:hypothetical protein